MVTKRFLTLRHTREDMVVRYRTGYIGFCALLAMVLAVCPCAASGQAPGEDQAGLLYRCTHLHPAAYLILFLIFILSVANLAYQGKISRDNILIRLVLSFFRKSRTGLRGEPPFEGRLKGRGAGPSAREKKRSRALDLRRMPNEPHEAAIVAVRRLEKTTGEGPYSELPTPLEGVNHPLPEFGSHEAPETGKPRLAESRPGTKASSSQFKFSSTVDLPSHEEIERREKEQLVVSGSVKGLDGKGMASVIVFLTDTEGNRVGQSCRSMPETGEFRVLTNEPGKYALNGYKRGFVMESSESMVLPIESGKIEGYNFKMIPEGCVVQGRVLFEAADETLPWVHVMCVCSNENISRYTQTGAGGQFRIAGIPLAGICHIEVMDDSQTVLFRSDTFEIMQKKEVYMEIKIPQALTAVDK